MPAAAADGAGDELREVSGEPSGARAALPMLDDSLRSPDPGICPFFRREVDGQLFAPGPEPEDAGRCIAVGGPRPQSQRQQQLVCLRSVHADCPRYLRGAIAVAEPPARRTPTVPRATLAALLVLVLSAGISFGFVLQRGGIDLPAAAIPSASAFAILATPTPVKTLAPTLVPTPAPTTSQGGSPSPSPEATPPPTPSPTPEATPVPTATPSPTPRPTSDRYALLKPCPDKPGCWIYTVRSGNNLFSIAKYFGVPLATIYAWNPRYANGAHLRAGDQIRMPPPTR